MQLPPPRWLFQSAGEKGHSWDREESTGDLDQASQGWSFFRCFFGAQKNNQVFVHGYFMVFPMYFIFFIFTENMGFTKCDSQWTEW